MLGDPLNTIDLCLPNLPLYIPKKMCAISTGVCISTCWCAYFKYGAAGELWQGTCMESCGQGWQYSVHCFSVHELVIQLSSLQSPVCRLWNSQNREEDFIKTNAREKHLYINGKKNQLKYCIITWSIHYRGCLKVFISYCLGSIQR